MKEKNNLVWYIVGGFLIGVFLQQLFSLISSSIVSAQLGRNEYYPVVPQLAQAIGSPLKAVWLQFVWGGLLGAAFSAASLIFQIEKWSILRQTVTHFVVASLIMLPTAYMLKWMPPTLKGFAVYFGIFAGIYVIIWVVQYLVMRQKIQQMNAHLQG